MLLKADIELAELRARLQEAEETLDAIRSGEVDAVVVGGPAGQQVYTLQNADRPYRVLVEQMKEGAVTFGKDGSIFYCNEHFATLVEEKRERLVGSKISSFLLGTDFGIVLRNLIATGPRAKSVAEFLLLSATGTSVPVNVSLVDLIVEDNCPRMFCAIITDLSLIRKRTDELATANAKLAIEIEERRRAQESLQLTLDAAQMGSWDLDLRRETTERSLRHDQLFGYTELQTGWSPQVSLDHIFPDDREFVKEAFARGARSGRVDVEARIQRVDDGSIRWLRITGQTFYENDKAVRIAGVVADVTDRRAVEERARQTQRIEAMGQLTSGVAHDFNNLLMVISGGLEMLDRQPDPARRARILSGMRQATDRGTGLTRQLLAFSRRQALLPEPVNLVRQINQMQELLDRSLRGDVEVKLALNHDLWGVEVDPGELELVLLNLTVNARDAMPGGGVIAIHGANVQNHSDGELVGDFVRLTVVDTGTGMSPEVAARAFEPFFTTKETGKGSGLGLAQTYGFAHASGGGVRIETTPGVGTRIHLFLPKTSKLLPNDQDQQVVDAGGASASGQILIVEDDDEVAALTIEMIEYLGYHTTRVSGPEAALGALANGRRIDLVFSDIMMPGSMNGVDLACEIRRRRPDMPVLLTSGYSDAAKKRAEIEGLRILAKPFRLEDLAQAFDLIRRASQSGSHLH